MTEDNYCLRPALKEFYLFLSAECDTSLTTQYILKKLHMSLRHQLRNDGSIFSIYEEITLIIWCTLKTCSMLYLSGHHGH